MKRLEVKVCGQVQGVFFRAYLSLKAKELGLRGWARNEPDGTVRVVTEGDERSLEKFGGACKIGPKFAKVEKVEIAWKKATGEFKNFETE